MNTFHWFSIEILGPRYSTHIWSRSTRYSPASHAWDFGTSYVSLLSSKWCSKAGNLSLHQHSPGRQGASIVNSDLFDLQRTCNVQPRQPGCQRLQRWKPTEGFHGDDALLSRSPIDEVLPPTPFIDTVPGFPRQSSRLSWVLCDPSWFALTTS